MFDSRQNVGCFIMVFVQGCCLCLRKTFFIIPIFLVLKYKVTFSVVYASINYQNEHASVLKQTYIGVLVGENSVRKLFQYDSCLNLVKPVLKILAPENVIS